MNRQIEKQTASRINKLIKVCFNGKQGYLAAMENVDDTTMKEIFLDFSSQRAAFAADLRACVRRLKFTPEDKGTVSGFFHRSWIHVKGIISKAETKSIIAECINGDQNAMKIYSQVLDQPELSADIKAIIEKQLQAIGSAHSLLKVSHEMMADFSTKEVS